MAKRRMYPAAMIDKLRRAFAALPVPVPRMLTRRKLVTALGAKIRDAQSQGYSLAYIAGLMVGAGMNISPAELRRDLAQNKGARNSNGRTDNDRLH
jgi:hypothetical protein